jgi:starch synthase (maltosyl-transferring)
VKRVIGDRLVVEADLVADGHDRLAGVLVVRHEDASGPMEIPLAAIGNDRYRAELELTELGRFHYRIVAWVDAFETWRGGLARKAGAGLDVAVDLLAGAALVSAAAGRAGRGDDATLLRAAAKELSARRRPLDERVAGALDETLAAAVARHPDRSLATAMEDELVAVVDRKRARFSSWYEMFPRSCGKDSAHGTFRDAEKRLPYVAGMGWNVLYLPPIHPIGTTKRKGRENALVADPADPGSPWAIGDASGGHTAVHAALGTLDDFRRFVRAAESYGVEIALDLAFQASPDHPWVKEHPTWFARRPDGTIQFAENPPKKYEDIVPFDFGSEDWEALWRALRDVVFFWIDQGVRIFRVDNPHTKSLRFWEWCIAEVKARHRDVIFLAEAFTRPKLMYALARLGFSQSYTYFTWRVTKQELVDYMRELTSGEVAEFFRPNFWPNTPDILPELLQHGGRPAFVQRMVLAATLGSNWGIYGPPFELMESVARSGAEEYAGSEKYELRRWDVDRPETLAPLLARLNRIRNAHAALQDNGSLRFHPVDNERLLVYSKRSAEEVILCVVNLDPHHRHTGWVDLDLDELGLRPDRAFQVHDLLGDARFLWEGSRNFVDLDPQVMPAHVLRVRRHARTEHDFDYFL